MPAPSRRLARGFAMAAALLAALAACTLPREPRFDAAVTAAVQDLAADTNLLFEEIALADGRVPFADRAPRYRALAASAETVRMLAEARGSAIGGAPLAGLDAAYRDATQAYMSDYLRNLRMLEDADRAATAALSERAARHEAGLALHRAEVEAYLDALGLWEAGYGPRPEAPGPAPEPLATALTPRQVAIRRVAIGDILRDALIYERDILNRDR